ncbi:NADPH quinone oxidoreductase [Streptomyces alfalfae]|uniref:NADPH quinone oxidoreductase n=1 Tax=Streptomyces alfalfae TaxID=1642299 RepID=A0A1P8THA1_9ACTN|nr:zinc-binding dehydrogenase [Streptomyces alfalfae]AYA17413.1 NADPH quinone oxidoreductase [Streptomyces fradiae]APY87022.1 NADPH quinone oxidoreductase [Streptomyces alfalfae]QQC90720.1 zinc-binding dehydrogenase [Streptomyces alfalfae]RXX37078.1 NADPH quinone oxidoreductase [Streptomyces alfalfae]RZM87332.1 NADPH quinone oxidoreductase [Streptomyces alfalfae]
MHAVVLHEFGPAENLTYETWPDPVAGPGQVRIAVRAAGAHFVETVMRRGEASDKAPPLPELPAVLGGEVAGVVDAVGPGVDQGWLGRSVVTARSAPGGYAESTVAEASALHPVPDGLGFEDAVTMVVTGATTMGLLGIAGLRPDDVVLVTSAAGGIGRLVVQYAHALGATVVGAAGGPEKTEAVRALGADVAVDYDRPGWQETVRERLGGGRPVTAILDGVGGDKAASAFDLLATGGRYVVIGWSSQQAFEPPRGLLAERGVTHVNALLELIAHPEEGPAREREALEAAAKGELAPAWQAFPLAEAARAHAEMERRGTTGKVVLVP